MLLGLILNNTALVIFTVDRGIISLIIYYFSNY